MYLKAITRLKEKDEKSKTLFLLSYSRHLFQRPMGPLLLSPMPGQSNYNMARQSM